MLVVLLLLLAAPPARADVPYTVEIAGVENKQLRRILRDVSRLASEVGRPPPTRAALRRRAAADLPLLEEALDSLGYYGATIDVDIDDAVQPVRVTLRIEPGEPYRIEGFRVTGDNPALADGRIRLTPEALGLRQGDIAEARRVIEAEARLLAELSAQAYPLARVADRKVIVDHATRSMRVDWEVDTGPAARFGAVTIQGLTSVDESFVRSRIPWRPGEPFDGRKVEEGRRQLVDMQLFSAVRIDHAGALGAEGDLPVIINLAEAKHRSIGGGGSYSTSRGFTAEGFWEHRNLFGAGERLRLSLLAGQQIQGGLGNLRIPGYADPRLDWLGTAQATREHLEAYDAVTIGGFGGVEYDVSRELSVNGGLSLQWLDIDEGTFEERYLLAGAPIGLAYDSTDDLLDPSRGTRVNLGVTPYVSLAEEGDSFTLITLFNSAYLQLLTENRVVLAGWGRVGTIVGADSTPDVPATKRFYGGGANSVRAYGYQELGAVGADGDPTGGRSQLEGGLELRWRMFEDFGGAVFFEGGQIYDGPVPDFADRFQWGGGVGVRYLTTFGPIRADVAFPVNPRDSDSAFQFYIGLGQAF